MVIAIKIKNPYLSVQKFQILVIAIHLKVHKNAYTLISITRLILKTKKQKNFKKYLLLDTDVENK